MFEVTVNQEKQKYHSKPTLDVDITGSSASIPKPLTYDYMPEGYPKKDGWSIEWDGNIDGKISAIGAPLYKFSDRVLTYEEFLSAMVVRYQDGESYSKMVQEASPEQSQVTDAVSSFICSFGGEVQFLVVSEDNVEANGIIFPTKGLYTHKDKIPFKLIEETITPMSTDFIPKNFNVVFSEESSSSMPDSCNVTYDELRGWIEKGVPVFAIYKTKDNDGSVVNVINITGFLANTDSLTVYYLSGSGKCYFEYNSDGTISGSGGPS